MRDLRAKGEVVGEEGVRDEGAALRARASFGAECGGKGADYGPEKDGKSGEFSLAGAEAVVGEGGGFGVGFGVEQIGFHSTVISEGNGSFSTWAANKCEV